MHKLKFYKFSIFLICCLAVILFLTKSKTAGIISPLANNQTKTLQKNAYEVFGFAPWWNLNKLTNVDFNTLTTLAYFGIPVNSDGGFAEDNIGFTKLKSKDAQDLFNKAHKNGTRVVLTLTMMDNDSIESFLDNKNAQKKTINKTLALEKSKKLDGVNIDFEYVGDPGEKSRKQFSQFVKEVTDRFHKEIPNSKISVSVYAASAKDPKLYDIEQVAKNSDEIFMMAYDFATTSSQKAMPTAPLYGYKQGKYWYDVSTAVEDFTKKMPAEKLVLGLPWYGYDYPVNQPSVNAQRDNGYSYWYKVWITKYKYVWRLASYAPSSFVQTYKNGSENSITEAGWDNLGKVGWKAYKDGDTWRIYFLEDEKSLSIKYDFAKQKGLGGVGIWALGFDDGHTELWNLLSREFGAKIASAINE